MKAGAKMAVRRMVRLSDQQEFFEVQLNGLAIGQFREERWARVLTTSIMANDSAVGVILAFEEHLKAALAGNMEQTKATMLELRRLIAEMKKTIQELNALSDDVAPAAPPAPPDLH